MKYMVTHSCGHEEEVAILGSSRDRDRKIAWLSSIPCRECQEKAAQKEADDKAKELGLPELTGSQKQIDWAQRIRIQKLDELNGQADQAQRERDLLNRRLEAGEFSDDKADKARKYIEKYERILTLALETINTASAITEAHWWIENRSGGAKEIAEACKALKEAEVEKAIEEETKPAMVIMEPEEKKTSTVCTLRVSDKEAFVQCDKDEHVRLTVKAHGFTWDGSRTAWVKPVTELTGEAKDLAPDTARILLGAGIPVKAFPEIKELVESGDYEVETKRWISRSTKDPSKLFIAKTDGVKLPDACHKTYNGDGVISATMWREVREFAELNGYKVTRSADEMLRKAEAATVSVKLAEKTDNAPNAMDALKAVLESSRDILEDLKEEE